MARAQGHGAARLAGMRRAHTVEQVRAAEAALMARLPEGTLMQRAAHGLAQAVERLCRNATDAVIDGYNILILPTTGRYFQARSR